MPFADFPADVVASGRLHLLDAIGVGSCRGGHRRRRALSQGRPHPWWRGTRKHLGFARDAGFRDGSAAQRRPRSTAWSSTTPIPLRSCMAVPCSHRQRWLWRRSEMPAVQTCCGPTSSAGRSWCASGLRRRALSRHADFRSRRLAGRSWRRCWPPRLLRLDEDCTVACSRHRAEPDRPGCSSS